MKAFSLALIASVCSIIASTSECLTGNHHHHQQPYYAPRLRAKIASSVAKGERRAAERLAVRRELCHQCRRPPVQCVCAWLPKERISTATDILILQHPAEFRRKTFSTVPLLPLVLRNVQVCVGHSFDPEGVTPIRHAVSKGQRLLLLFPGPQAQSLDSIISSPKQLQENETDETRHQPEREGCISSPLSGNSKDDFCKDSTRSTMLILIDGTWTQARRMVRNSPALLERCQQVQFTAQSSSLYGAVRKEPAAHCLSTLEACTQALELLEPDEKASNTAAARRHLHAALQSLVDMQLRYSSSSGGGSGTSVAEDSAAVPRFVGRAEKALKKKQRRLQVEKELFGPHEFDNVGQEASQHIQQLADGAILRPLRLSDASFVDSRWPHRSAKSLEMIQYQIAQEAQKSSQAGGGGGGGGCLGIEIDRELCASIMRYPNGALGMLHVDEACRRRGYGSALVNEATKRAIATSSTTCTAGEQEQGSACFCYILDGNTASEQLFLKNGWVRDPNGNNATKRGTGKRRAKRKWIKQLV